jgi:hypothetical protein
VPHRLAAADQGGEKGGYTDVKLYHDMAAQVAKGENYYPAAATCTAPITIRSSPS